MRRVLAGHDLAVRYVGGEPVLTGADLEVDAARRVAVLGANGSGKTTLLRVLSGALRPDRGAVLLGGRRLHHDRRGLRHHREQVQLVLQNPDDQLFSASVRQDVSFGPVNLGLSDAVVRQRVEAALDLVGMGAAADRPTHRLSFGERKRVAVAGALAMRPAVLLLDEPTAGLDPLGVAETVRALEHLRRSGTGVVLATHDVDLALRWADDVVLVADGLTRQGPAIEMLCDAAALARCRLLAPTVLQVAEVLRRRGLGGSGAPPRDVDALVAWMGTTSPSNRRDEACDVPR